MIKEHQVKSLEDRSKVCEAGFLLNFRRTGNTYYLAIQDFIKVASTVNKSSLNEADIKQFAIVIPHKVLKVNHRYDLSVLFE